MEIWTKKVFCTNSGIFSEDLKMRLYGKEVAEVILKQFPDTSLTDLESDILNSNLIYKHDSIDDLDFGKDKYQFYIGKNKGSDGQYYDMFMDEALEISPDSLSGSMVRDMIAMSRYSSFSSKPTKYVFVTILLHTFSPGSYAKAFTTVALSIR